MAFTSTRLSQMLPKALRIPVERIELLWSTGMLADPISLARQWQHRRAFFKVQKALLYHRYATAMLLGHEVGLYDALAAKPLTIQKTATACAIHPRAAEALLRILESQGLVICRNGSYDLTPFGRAYLIEGSQFSIAPMLSLMAAQAAAFGELPASMASGKTPKALDIFAKNGRYKAFLGAVNEYLNWASRDLLADLDLPPIKDFIVGSMGVSFSANLMRRFPDANVTYGCLKHLVVEIPRLREKYDVDGDRVTGMHNHGGDPSQDKWGGETYDLVFLTKKMILEPEQRMGEKFAAKAFEVLRPGGVVILWETVHPGEGRTPLAHAMEAVLDLGASPTGLVTTDVKMRKMLSKIGFQKVDLVPCLGGQTTFVVARKAS